MTDWRDFVWGKRAFFQRYDCKPSKPFLDGFLEGYHEICQGGEGCLPVVPPKRYWGWRYQSAGGQNAINDWFGGFEQGVVAAREDGLENLSTIQLSSHYTDLRGTPIEELKSEQPKPTYLPTKSSESTRQAFWNDKNLNGKKQSDPSQKRNLLPPYHSRVWPANRIERVGKYGQESGNQTQKIEDVQVGSSVSKATSETTVLPAEPTKLTKLPTKELEIPLAVSGNLNAHAAEMDWQKSSRKTAQESSRDQEMPLSATPLRLKQRNLKPPISYPAVSPLLPDRN